MRLLFGALALIAAAVAFVPAGAAQAPRQWSQVRDKLTESMRLEGRALGLFQQDPKSDEIRPLLDRSVQLLDESAGYPIPSESLTFLAEARKYDREFFREAERYPAYAAQLLRTAIAFKWAVLDDLDDLPFTDSPLGFKDSPKASVSAPACRYAAAVSPPSIAGCSKVDFWEIYVPAKVRTARCAFVGPRGKLRPDRLLFAKTVQFTSCTVAGLKTVDGERKRVVRATLQIVVPPGVTASGAKPVHVTARWQ